MVFYFNTGLVQSHALGQDYSGCKRTRLDEAAIFLPAPSQVVSHWGIFREWILGSLQHIGQLASFYLNQLVCHCHSSQGVWRVGDLHFDCQQTLCHVQKGPLALNNSLAYIHYLTLPTMVCKLCQFPCNISVFACDCTLVYSPSLMFPCWNPLWSGTSFIVFPKPHAVFKQFPA